MQDLSNSDGTVASLLFLGGQECSTTELRGDDRWSMARSQAIDELGESSQNLVSMVRGGAPDGFLKMTRAQTKWTRGGALREGSDSLVGCWL